ncbi:AAA family ATPase [Rothia nasimurium]|uniref:AAA family ATPase n=1 Tax=Rothia nasimurium TaxID=85336 RepID=UPI003BA11820
MRLHHLTLTAYGPFAGTVSIDFDDLNREGIFLLNGPTGSGKSSILDAICFALYGSTASGRKDLKSRFADPSQKPEVELVCTIAGKRYRIVRNPEYVRPGKRKNSGLQKENAKVLIQTLDRVTGESTPDPAITRIDEAATFILEKMGLTAAQFNQVMLLPQGQFQQFLTATSADREKLLRQLFGAEDYQRIEETLKDHARKAQDAASQATVKRDADMNRVQRALASTAIEQARDLLGIKDLADHEALEQEAPTSEPTSLLALAATCSADIEELRNNLEGALAEKTALLEDLADRKKNLAQEIDHWQEYNRLTTLQEELHNQKPTIDQHNHALSRHRAAELVGPFMTAARRAETALAEAHQRAELARNQAADSIRAAQELLSGPALETDLLTQASGLVHRELTEDVLLDFSRQAEETIQALANFHRDELLRADTAQKYEVARTHLAQAQHKLTAALETQKNLEESMAADRAAYEEVDLAPVHYETAQADLAAAQQALAQAKKLTQARKKTEATAAAASSAEAKRRQVAHEYETLQRQRFENAAHTLALALTPGQPCAVCGSENHPNPATENGRAVTDIELETAATARAAAEEQATRALAEHATASGALAQLIDNGAPEPDAAASAHQAAEAKLAKAQTALAQRKALAVRLQETETKLQKATANVTDCQQAIITSQSQLETHSSTMTTLEEALAPHRQQLPFNQRASRLQHITSHLNQILTAQTEHGRYQEQATSTQQELHQALKESPFSDTAEATAALLPPATAATYEASVTEHRNQTLSVQALLGNDSMKQIRKLQQTGRTAPNQADLDQLSHQLTEARQERDRLMTTSTRLTTLSEELLDARADLARSISHNQKLIEDAHLKKQLADVANGLSHDNRLRMTLSTYVLAFQLSEVAEAASDHLQRMTHGRYRLEHTDESDGRTRKSGLGLNVFDAWHNAARKPDSLSGGETFMASLALALGLADVVQAANGGIDIDTLFVDEGFGSLDDETLEEVMATIDDLREGGRVIGLISHVAEMKNRITKHIQLATSPQGSHLVTEQGAL